MIGAALPLLLVSFIRIVPYFDDLLVLTSSQNPLQEGSTGHPEFTGIVEQSGEIKPDTLTYCHLSGIHSEFPRSKDVSIRKQDLQTQWVDFYQRLLQ